MTKMRKILFLFLMMSLAGSVTAQRQMKDLLITMPDSLVGYLNTTKRTEMVDFYHMGVKAETYNLLGGMTVLDSLTANYADLSLNERVRMQLALLGTQHNDTLICMVRTYQGEAPESVIRFYRSDWKTADGQMILSPEPTSLIQRPDTMSQERFEQLQRLIDPLMVSAEMSPADLSLSFSVSTPMLLKEDKERVKAILLQRKFKWDGQRYN